MSFVQQVSAVAETGGGSSPGATLTTRTVTLPVAPTAGNLLVLAMRVPSGRHVTGVTDTRGNTWSLDVATGGGNQNCAIASCIPATPLTTSDTITFTYGASGSIVCGWELLEFSSMAAVATDSANGGVANALGGTTITLATATTGAADLVVTTFSSGLDQGAGGITPPAAPWVEVPLGTAKNFLDVAYQDRLPAGSTPSATWTQTTSTNLAVAMAAYVGTSGPTSATATGAVTLSGTGTPTSRATAAGAVTLGGTGTAGSSSAATAAGVIALAGSATGVSRATGAGSVTLSGAPGANAAPASSGSITLGGAGATSAQSAAAGSITLGGAGSPTAQPAATGSITLGGSGTGTPGGANTASGTVTLGGTATAQAATAATGTVTLGGTGSPQARPVATGTVTLGGTATPAVSPTAAGSIILTAAGTAQAIPSSAGAVTLTAGGTAVARASLVGLVTLTGTGTAVGPPTAAAAAGTITLGGGAIGTNPLALPVLGGPNETLVVPAESRVFVIPPEIRTAATSS